MCVKKLINAVFSGDIDALHQLSLVIIIITLIGQNTEYYKIIISQVSLEGIGI